MPRKVSYHPSHFSLKVLIDIGPPVGAAVALPHCGTSVRTGTPAQGLDEKYSALTSTGGIRMHHLNHVHRRGAVYVWRRRMPATCSDTRSFVQVSLRTREFSTAKNLATLLNSAFCDSILKVKMQKITRAEAQQFLTAIISDEFERIEAER